MKRIEISKKIEEMRCPHDKCKSNLKGALIAKAEENKYYTICPCCNAVSRIEIKDGKVLLSITKEKNTEEMEVALKAFIKEYPGLRIHGVATSKEAEAMRTLRDASIMDSRNYKEEIEEEIKENNLEDLEDLEEFEEDLSAYEDIICPDCDDEFIFEYERRKDYLVECKSGHREIFKGYTKEELSSVLTEMENETTETTDRVFEIKEIHFNRKVTLDF